MTQSVNECGTQDLILKDLFPTGKRQIGGDNGSPLSRPQRKVVKEHLRTLLVKAHILTSYLSPLRKCMRIQILLHLLLIVVGDGDKDIAEDNTEAVDRAHWIEFRFMIADH